MAASTNASYRNDLESTFSCDAIIIAMPYLPEHNENFVGQIWQEISIS